MARTVHLIQPALLDLSVKMGTSPDPLGLSYVPSDLLGEGHAPRETGTQCPQPKTLIAYLTKHLPSYVKKTPPEVNAPAAARDAG